MFEIFPEFAKFVRNIRPFLQNLILFAKIQSFWCEMENLHFLSNENEVGNCVKNTSKFAKILNENLMAHLMI